MLHFTHYTVKTDNPDMRIRRISTGEVFGTTACGTIAAHDDYEEVPAADIAAAQQAAHRREQYVQRVRDLIHQRYNTDDENAILRKNLGSIVAGTPADPYALAEFTAYNAFVEQCKEQAAREAEEGDPL